MAKKIDHSSLVRESIANFNLDDTELKQKLDEVKGRTPSNENEMKNDPNQEDNVSKEVTHSKTIDKESKSSQEDNSNTKKENSGNKSKVNTKKTTVQRTTNKNNKLDWFNEIMSIDDFRDKKDNFYFALSGEVLNNIEKLVKVMNYKLDVDIKRNDVIRKLVENFIKNDIDEILDELEKLK